MTMWWAWVCLAVALGASRVAAADAVTDAGVVNGVREGQQPTWAWTASDRRVAHLMAGYWTNFVKTGDPNGPGLPTWPRYHGGDAGAFLLEDDATAAGVPDLQTLKAFDAVYAQLRRLAPH